MRREPKGPSSRREAFRPAKGEEEPHQAQAAEAVGQAGPTASDSSNGGLTVLG